MPKRTGHSIKMPCIFEFCDGLAPVKVGVAGRIRGAKFMDYTCVCDCKARWSFTEEHFKRLDQLGRFVRK
jgi:hypothetical protein